MSLIAYGNNFGKVSAPTGDTAISTKFLDIQTGLPAIYDAALYAALVIFIVLLLVGGVQYLAAAGGEGTAKAKKLIQAAVVGFVLVFGTWAVIALVLKLVGYKF